MTPIRLRSQAEARRAGEAILAEARRMLEQQAAAPQDREQALLAMVEALVGVNLEDLNAEQAAARLVGEHGVGKEPSILARALRRREAKVVRATFEIDAAGRIDAKVPAAVAALELKAGTWRISAPKSVQQMTA